MTNKELKERLENATVDLKPRFIDIVDNEEREIHFIIVTDKYKGNSFPQRSSEVLDLILQKDYVLFNNYVITVDSYTISEYNEYSTPQERITI